MKKSFLLLSIILFLLTGCVNVSDDPDTAAPSVSGSVTTASTTAESITITWPQATDNQSAQNKLEYAVYYSTNSGLNTLAAVTNGATLLSNWSTG